MKMESIPIHANALKDLKVGPNYNSTPEVLGSPVVSTFGI